MNFCTKYYNYVHYSLNTLLLPSCLLQLKWVISATSQPRTDSDHTCWSSSFKSRPSPLPPSAFSSTEPSSSGPNILQMPTMVSTSSKQILLFHALLSHRKAILEFHNESAINQTMVTNLPFLCIKIKIFITNRKLFFSQILLFKAASILSLDSNRKLFFSQILLFKAASILSLDISFLI